MDQALNILIKSIRKGQNDGRYLVLDVDLLQELDGITCSMQPIWGRKGG